MGWRAKRSQLAFPHATPCRSAPHCSDARAAEQSDAGRTRNLVRANETTVYEAQAGAGEAGVSAVSYAGLGIFVLSAANLLFAIIKGRIIPGRLPNKIFDRKRDPLQFWANFIFFCCFGLIGLYIAFPFRISAGL